MSRGLHLQLQRKSVATPPPSGTTEVSLGDKNGVLLFCTIKIRNSPTPVKSIFSLLSSIPARLRGNGPEIRASHAFSHLFARMVLDQFSEQFVPNSLNKLF